MAIQVPSIWDYIAQAGNQGVGSFVESRENRLARDEREAMRKQQEEMNLLGMLASGVANGTMFSDEANRNPIAASRGMVFQPSPVERASRIAASPTGVPSIGAPMGGAGVFAPTVNFKPWTDDQRRMANLPTQDQMDIESTAGAVARTQKEVTGFEQYKPVITDAAERYVAEAMGAGIDIERFPRMIATSAYSAWLKEQESAGNMGINDPGIQSHARTFFDQAVQKVIARQVELRALTTRAENSGRSGESDRIRWAQLLQRRKEALLKNIPWAESLTESAAQRFIDPSSDSYMPEVANALQEKYRLERALNEISGTNPVSAETQAYVNSIGGGAPTASAAPAGASGAPAGGPPVLTPDQIRDSVREGRLIPASERQAWFDEGKSFIDPQSAKAIASQLGVRP